MSNNLYGLDLHFDSLDVKTPEYGSRIAVLLKNNPNFIYICRVRDNLTYWNDCLSSDMKGGRYTDAEESREMVGRILGGEEPRMAFDSFTEDGNNNYIGRTFASNEIKYWTYI